MTSRRSVPLLLAAAATIAVACTGLTDLHSVPFGFVTLVAQRAGAGFTASPIGTFYDAGGLGVPSAVSPWDSCRLQSYSPAAAVRLGDIYASISAGASIVVRVSGRTDSLYPVALGSETQYKLRAPLAVPYRPGDSVSVAIPGTSSGYPAISFTAKTAEAVVVTDFAPPASGSRLDLKWNAGQDLNGTMSFSFRYGALDTDTLNTQVYCQFKDDGADSIPAKFISSWAAARTRTWTASRVRTFVAPVAKGGYFDFISTFDLPTPVSP